MLTPNAHHAKKVSLNDIDELSEAICKISIRTNHGEINGTGFFIIVMDKNKKAHKFLISTSHIISSHIINCYNKISIIKNNGEEYKIKLKDNLRFIISLNEPIDIISVEILEKDKINNVKYLEYDLNGIDNQYINKEILILQYPEGKFHESSGIIKNINEEKKYEFEHTSDTSNGSPGSPVILIENLKVIGIHKKRIEKSDNKKGTFISIILEKIKKKLNKADSNKIIEMNYNNQMNQININNNIENNIIILKYFLDKENLIILLNNGFFNKNKKNIKIYIDEKEYKSNYINKDEYIKNKSQELEIKVKVIQPLKDMSNMFLNCISIKSISFINFDTSKVIYMNGIFKGCCNLREIYGISEFDTSNIKGISELFSDCRSLKVLPENLNWNTSKIKKMKDLFYNCKSLEVLPDISKWNTSNVLNMSGLFKNCISLIRIPNIQDWNTKNVQDMSNMFLKCERIEELPDISFWSTKKLRNISNMFSSCNSLKSIPNISKWKIGNVELMKYS